MNLRNLLVLVVGVVIGVSVAAWFDDDTIDPSVLETSRVKGYHDGWYAGRAALMDELGIGQPGPPGPRGVPG